VRLCTNLAALEAPWQGSGFFQNDSSSGLVDGAIFIVELKSV